MTSDNLLRFLSNREYMHQISYQELKSMVVQYPYSLSLRYLLAMKSRQEDNTDLDRNIALLSTYGIDRSHLHKVFSEDPIILEDLDESIIMGEDFLELKELSFLERDLDKKLTVNEGNDLSFLPEENQLTVKEIPLPNPTINVPPPPPIIDILANSNQEGISIETSVDKEEILESTRSNLTETSKIELPPIPIEATNSPIFKENEEMPLLEETTELEEEEEFITLGFEADITAEISKKITDEVAPSSASTNKEVIEATNGLPIDAVEVNDLSYAEITKSVVDDALIDELFEETAAEAIAESAVSDSMTFIENPAENLVTESELIASESTKEAEESTDLVVNEPLEMPIASAAIMPNPPIPFEIEYSEADPITIASIQEGTEVVLPEEEAVIPQATVTNDVDEVVQSTPVDSTQEISKEVKENIEAVKETLPTVEVVAVSDIIAHQEIPAEIQTANISEKVVSEKEITTTPAKASFNRPTKIIKPAVKTKFGSWQAQYADVHQFSSATSLLLPNGTGKIIKRIRKAGQKRFAKTVAFAEESLTSNNALTSETLAQLLVEQGQYTRARAMYEELCLLMPKKSSFFASEIEKIKNLPDEDS